MDIREASPLAVPASDGGRGAGRLGFSRSMWPEAERWRRCCPRGAPLSPEAPSCQPAHNQSHQRLLCSGNRFLQHSGLHLARWNLLTLPIM